MEETKLTVRVPKDALLAAKRYAAKNKTTLTRLITVYLERLDRMQEADGDDLPLEVRRLTGIAGGRVTEEDYHRHLVEKYLGENARPD